MYHRVTAFYVILTLFLCVENNYSGKPSQDLLCFVCLFVCLFVCFFICLACLLFFSFCLFAACPKTKIVLRMMKTQIMELNARYVRASYWIFFCFFICAFVILYVCISLCVWVCVFVRMWQWICALLCARLYVSVFVSACFCIFLRVSLCVPVCVFRYL